MLPNGNGTGNKSNELKSASYSPLHLSPETPKENGLTPHRKQLCYWLPHTICTALTQGDQKPQVDLILSESKKTSGMLFTATTDTPTTLLLMSPSNDHVQQINAKHRGVKQANLSDSASELAILRAQHPNAIILLPRLDCSIHNPHWTLILIKENAYYLFDPKKSLSPDRYPTHNIKEAFAIENLQVCFAQLQARTGPDYSAYYLGHIIQTIILNLSTGIVTTFPACDINQLITTYNAVSAQASIQPNPTYQGLGSSTFLNDSAPSSIRYNPDDIKAITFIDELEDEIKECPINRHPTLSLLQIIKAICTENWSHKTPRRVAKMAELNQEISDYLTQLNRQFISISKKGVMTIDDIPGLHNAALPSKKSLLKGLRDTIAVLADHQYVVSPAMGNLLTAAEDKYFGLSELGGSEDNNLYSIAAEMYETILSQHHRDCIELNLTIKKLSTYLQHLLQNKTDDLSLYEKTQSFDEWARLYDDVVKQHYQKRQKPAPVIGLEDKQKYYAKAKEKLLIAQSSDFASLCNKIEIIQAIHKTITDDSTPANIRLENYNVELSKHKILIDTRRTLPILSYFFPAEGKKLTNDTLTPNLSIKIEISPPLNQL